jgi:hypothetical protein
VQDLSLHRLLARPGLDIDSHPLCLAQLSPTELPRRVRRAVTAVDLNCLACCSLLDLQIFRE